MDFKRGTKNETFYNELENGQENDEEPNSDRDYSYLRGSCAHWVSAHANLDKLVSNIIRFSANERTLILLVIVSLRGNPVCAGTP